MCRRLPTRLLLLPALLLPAVARAGVDPARAMLRQTQVTAPVGGRIGLARVSAGNLVRGGEAAPVLATIVATEPMYVYFEMDERTLLRFQKMLRQKKAQDVRTPV